MWESQLLVSNYELEASRAPFFCHTWAHTPELCCDLILEVGLQARRSSGGRGVDLKKTESPFAINPLDAR